MQVELKIDADAVQQKLVDSLIQSGIGTQIEKAISELLKKEFGSWDNRMTLVQSAVHEALRNELARLARELVEERRGALKLQIAEKLNDEVFSQMTGAAVAIMLGKLKMVTD
jgi:hypothetical protein